MNNISEEIKQLHAAWYKAENLIPEQEYEKGYKSRTAKSRKLWRFFATACEAQGLKPVETALEINGLSKIYIQSSKKSK